MSEPQTSLQAGFIRGFKLLVDRIDPGDVVPGCIQHRILPLSEMEARLHGARTEQMMRLLGTIHRQSFVDRSTLSDFVSVLREKQAADSGHAGYGEIIDVITQSAPQASSCAVVPFDETDGLVFNFTRPVVEKYLEPRPILPALVSEGVITPEECENILEQNTRLAQVHYLMQVVQDGGSLAFERFVSTLSNAEDRSTIGVSNIVSKCLLAHRESPYTFTVPDKHNVDDDLKKVNPQRKTEIEAYRCAYSDLFTLMADSDPHLCVVNHLYSCHIIDKMARNSATDCTKQRIDQIRSLLQILETQIEQDPQSLHDIVHSLQQGPKQEFVELATVLQKHYDDLLQGRNAQHRRSSLYHVEADKCTSDCAAISPCVLEYQEKLREVYASTEGQGGQKWPGRKTDKAIPTNLAMIENEKAYRSTADAFTQPTLHGNIDEIDKSKKPITKECLFHGDKRCIVVQGAAGIGKSTFGFELAQDWAQGTAGLKQFKLVNLVQLRLPTTHSVTLIRDFLHPEPLQELVDEIEFAKGEGVLLILDGFDELPKSMQDRASVYGRLIQGKYLPKARILITSRPTAAKQLERLSPPEQTLHVEILGFQLQNIQAYVSDIFSDEPELQQAFLKYISSNLVIRNMMYIPLHTAIVVELFRMKNAARRPGTETSYDVTLTELFKDLCRCLLYRYMHSKPLDDLPSFDQLKLNSLPESIQSNFASLSSHAYSSLLQQELIFDSLPADFDHMGFMRTVAFQSNVPFAPPSHSYSFLHLTLQEFLAALHLYQTQPASRHLSMIQQIPKDHRNIVLRFLAGLSQFKEIGWTCVRESMGIMPDSQGNAGCNSTLLNCLFEAQDPEASEEVFPGDSTVNYSPMTATQFDYFALGYCIATSGQKCKWKLCAIGGEGLSAIAAGLCSVAADPHGRIEMIKLSYGGDKIHNLAKLPTSILEELRELNLSNCGLNNEACNWLARFICKDSLLLLRQLDLSDNPFSAGGACELLQSLSLLNDFQYLDLLHAQLGEEDLQSMKHLIRKNGTLKNLIIGDRAMTPDIVEHMVDVVLADSSLENISFMNIDFPRLAAHLAHRLKCNTTLKSVMLWDRSFCTSGAVEILNALSENETLGVVTLMPWYRGNIPSQVLSLPEVQNRIQWFIYPERKK